MTGRCAAGQRCRTRDGERGGWCGDGIGLCEPCFDAAGPAIAALTYDYVDLEQMMIPGAGRVGDPVSGSRELSIVINLDAEGHQRAIWLAATTWEEILREVDRLPDRPLVVRDGWAVQRAVEIIGPRLRLLAGLGPVAVMFDGEPVDMDGSDGIVNLVRLHAISRSMLGLTLKIEQLPGECSGCQMSTLRRVSGSETVYCDACERTWTWDAYHEYAALVFAYETEK